MAAAPSLDDARPTKQHRVEFPPDIPETSTSIPLLKEYIIKNNQETKPKKRASLLDVINECFQDACCSRDAAEVAFELLTEGREKHKMLPRSSYLARVLFYWHTKQHIDFAMRLIYFLLESQKHLPQFFKTSVDERVVSVALRCITSWKPQASSAGREDSLTSSYEQMNKKELVGELLAAVPPQTMRRRIFTPVFEECAQSHDAAMMLATLHAGLKGGMEFWDADYHWMLNSLESASSPAPTANKDGLITVLKAMEHHHPVVGKKNAIAIRELSHGNESTVDGRGVCSSCGETLSTFDFSEVERRAFVDDIMKTLIEPRIASASHYEPNRVVSDAVKETRKKELQTFLSRIEHSDYTAVIDGANIGYYGLTNWYSRAKSAMLTANGQDVSRVSYGELHDIPFPVDVSPQFETIDEMIQRAEALGFRPMVVLHERHTNVERIPQTNVRILERWQASNRILASPSFLNDDYCWLLATVARPKCVVITNDLMRDHHFCMLSQRSFLRWRQRHRLSYRAYFDNATQKVALRLRSLPTVSVWVQYSAVSQRWHIPFLSNCDILDQATNRLFGDGRDGKTEGSGCNSATYNLLEKDGSDGCDAWICTGSGF